MIKDLSFNTGIDVTENCTKVCLHMIIGNHNLGKRVIPGFFAVGDVRKGSKESCFRSG